jgi:hypothetical protein
VVLLSISEAWLNLETSLGYRRIFFNQSLIQCSLHGGIFVLKVFLGRGFNYSGATLGNSTLNSKSLW